MSGMAKGGRSHCVFLYLSGQPESCQCDGFSAAVGRNELTVDNFLVVFFFNNFNAQTKKSIKS